MSKQNTLEPQTKAADLTTKTESAPEIESLSSTEVINSAKSSTLPSPQVTIPSSFIPPQQKWYPYIWLSIVALFSFLWPLGVASLFIGQRATTLYESGHIAEAEKERQNSILLGVSSIAGMALICFLALLIKSST